MGRKEEINNRIYQRKILIKPKSSLNEFIRLIEPYIKHANKIKKIGGIKENLVLRGV